MESSALIGVKSVMSQLVTCYPTDRVDEIPMVKVFEPVLIQVVGIGTMIKVMR